MTKLIHVEGNIFNSTARAAGHGVNTIGEMGAGLAPKFRKLSEEMYQDYRRRCLTGMLVGGGLHAWEFPGSGYFIYNIASQEKPGRNASYDFLEAGVHRALLHAESHDIPVMALPRLGTGIGGLDESYVEGILFSLAKRSPVDIELWTYKP